MPVFGGEPRQTVENADAFDVSRDGGALLLQDRGALLVARTADIGGTLRRLEHIPWLTWWAVAPAISPDGSRVAYFVSLSGPIGELWVTETGGGEPQRLSNDAVRVSDPTFSADGGSVLFSSERMGSRSLARTRRGRSDGTGDLRRGRGLSADGVTFG